MKIGLFIDTFFPMVDGVVMVVDNYARRMCRTDEVTVFTSGEKERPEDSDLPYRVVRCKSLSLHMLDYSLPLPELDRDFNNELQNTELDIVHIHSPFFLGMAGVRYAKEHGIPVIGTMHSQLKLDFLRATFGIDFLADIPLDIVMKIYNKCDECWAVNHGISRIYREEYNYPKTPLIMPNATDLIPLCGEDYDKAVSEINQKHSISPDTTVLLFTGRINKLKNIMLIADALGVLKSRGLDFCMLFVGNGQDEDELKERIEKVGVADRTVFCGRVTNRVQLASYYARASLFLFPSMYDASSLVQIEAASQGTPTVFLKGSATSDGIEDGREGYLSDGTPEQYADKIISVLSDREEYERVCANVRSMLYKTWDDVTVLAKDRYTELLKG